MQILISMRGYNKYLSILLLFISLTAFGQRYEFDTFVEYEYIKTPESKPSRSFEFTNSKDNSYLLSIGERDRKTFSLMFMNSKGQEAITTISKKDFFAAESIFIECSSIRTIDLSKLKNKAQDADFYRLNDTVIKNDTLLHYVIRPKTDSITRYNGERHFIFQKGTDFHLPNLTPWTISYFTWKANHKLPNGLFRESFVIINNEIFEKMILLQYTMAKKIITVEQGCE